MLSTQILTILSTDCTTLKYDFLLNENAEHADSYDTEYRLHNVIHQTEWAFDNLTTERGINVEEEVQQEVEGMIDKHAADMHALPRTDFRRVFWDQQVWLMFIIIVYHYFL